jgi:hypothetical protein
MDTKYNPNKAAEDKVEAEKTARPRQVPTVGRQVHYTPAAPPGVYYAATIAKVNASGSVNLGGFNADGHTFTAQGVDEAEAGLVAGDERARGRWTWPVLSPPPGPQRHGGGIADGQPTPRPSPTGEPQTPPRP